MKNLILALGTLTLVSATSFNNSRPCGKISLTEMNIVYRNIKNPITFQSHSHDRKDLLFNVTGGYIETDTTSGWTKHYLIPQRGNKEMTVTLAAKEEDGRTRVLEKQKFRIRGLRQSIAQLGGLRNDGLPKPRAVIAAQTALLATYGPGFPYNLKARVLSFEAETIKGTERSSFIHNSSRLEPELHDKIKTLEPTDLVIFKNIKIGTFIDGDTLISYSPPIVTPIR